MAKRIEPIIKVEEVKQKDTIIFSYAGKTERYIIKSIDDFAVMAISEDRRCSISIFPISNLISDNWYIEKEG
jgi:hypothetical protein